jgi:glycerol-3-phosphate cytidylyltransferase-like family protein
MNSETEARVVALVTQINRVVAGLPVAEAQTALTLAVVCSIIVTAKDTELDRATMAKEFGKQVFDYVNRADIVEWIKTGTHWPTQISRRQQ